MRTQTFVIVGASLAGAKAAETLRSEGFDGRVLLIGEEPERPYERPPLSKDYLRGDADRHKVYVHDETFYADHDIELRTNTMVTALHPDHHTVELEGGEAVRYDRLLLTTGAAPRRLQVPGADLDGVHYLRSLADADHLAGALRDADRIVVIGAGWIGSEVAAAARQLGCDVALIDPGRVPLQRVLGTEVGVVYRDLHASHGVHLHLDAGVDSLHGAGRVEEVRLTDGTRLPADLVVVGVGAAPRVELAAAAGLAVDNGIVVDAHLRTRAGDVFAAGDVASAFHPTFRSRIRVEHWANAAHQGAAAAKNMLGTPSVYDRVPYFFSDQYELSMEYSGYATTWDRVVFRGDPAEGKFIAFWLAAGVVVAGMNANVWDVTDPVQHLIRQRAAVDVDRLADPDTPLDTVGADGPATRP
jgi:3-phenylpropionate/trans-cinnamate dioxygenase ferredoxin reductase component